MNHYVAIIDEKSENVKLLNRFLPAEYKFIWIRPENGNIDIKKIEDIKIIFINMDNKKSLYMSFYKIIKNKFSDCKVVWMTNNTGSALTAFEEHADAFMLLPINKERVSEVFRRLLRTA